MSKLTNLTLLPALLLSSAAAVSASAPTPSSSFARRLVTSLVVAASDREQDGLNGPVRRVKTETAKITVKNGRPAEGQRAVLETTTYDQKGARVDTAYFLAAGGTLTGREVYKYDDKGNMVEMTLHNDDGSLLSKETYSYEFDALGNWVKMTTSVAVLEGGKVTFEPSEVTYRTISYFLDDATLAKLSRPAPQPASPSPAASVPSSSAAAPSPSPSSPAAAPSPSAAAANVAAQPAAQKQPEAAKPSVNKAPVVMASLDKGTATAPSLPAAPSASNASAATEGGPAVKVAGDAPAPAPQPVVRGPLKPVSAGVLNGKALSLPAPEYPPMAKKTRATGTVEVEVIIDTNGKVISAKAVKGPALLLAAAEQAAKQARFTPTLLSGQPVKISGVINYTFTLN